MTMAVPERRGGGLRKRPARSMTTMRLLHDAPSGCIFLKRAGHWIERRRVHALRGKCKSTRGGQGKNKLGKGHLANSPFSVTLIKPTFPR